MPSRGCGLSDVFRIKPTATGGDLVWQYIDKDLTIRDTGKWSITLDQTKDVPILRYIPCERRARGER